MMKHLLTIVLCLTTLTGLAQEEKIKKIEWWNGNPLGLQVCAIMLS